MTVELKKSVNLSDTLWRYMSIDKLECLLKNNELYFTPLKSYESSDPYEGRMPPFIESWVRPNFESMLGDYTEIDQSRAKLNLIKQLYSTTVSCWHKNEVESDAMWRLYSDNGNGIAIKSSIESLGVSVDVESFDDDITIGCVTYVNYDSPVITGREALVEAGDIALFKRLSYAHENEIRAYIKHDIPLGETDSFETKADLVPVNISLLIENIFISPSADESFSASVKALCHKYGIEDKVIESVHLDPNETDLFSDLS